MVASARSLRAATSDFSAVYDSNTASRFPPISAVAASGEVRNGTMTTSMPAVERNSSAERFCVLPGLMVPKLSLPGFDRAAASRSPSVWYFDSGPVTMTMSKYATSDTGAKSFTGSNGRLLNSDFEIAVPLVRTSSVWPSGAAFITVDAAVTPPAPGWFSTTTCLPTRPVSFSATRRNVMSASPPGPNASTRRIGRSGNVAADCAPAAPQPIIASVADKSRTTNRYIKSPP